MQLYDILKAGKTDKAPDSRRSFVGLARFQNIV